MPVPQRLERHCVLKWDNIHDNLSIQEFRQFIELTAKINRNQPARNFVVVSDKYPELYEQVWGMKLAQVQRNINEQRESRRQRAEDIPAVFYVDELTESYEQLDIVEDNQAFTDLIYQ